MIKKKIYIYIYVFMKNTRYSCHILLKLEFSRQIFKKHSNTKFHENPFSGSRVIACGQRDGRRDRMGKLTVAFLNFTNAPKKKVCHSKREAHLIDRDMAISLVTFTIH